MKKTLAILAICVLLGSMSSVASVTTPQMNMVKTDEMKNLPSSDTTISLEGEDWTGEFKGAFGELKKISWSGEWNFTKWGYLAGYYKGGIKRGKFAGKLFDLNQTAFGAIGGYYGRHYLIGRIKIGEQKAPIIGFLFRNETFFIGRIMSFFGPAPHILGHHQPL